MTPEQEAMWPDGRLDVNGRRWFATDPFPTWFCHEDGEMVQRSNGTEWAAGVRYLGAYPWLDEYDFEDPANDRVYLRVRSDRRCSVHVGNSGWSWSNPPGTCGYHKDQHGANGWIKDHEFQPDTEVVLAPSGVFESKIWQAAYDQGVADAITAMDDNMQASPARANPYLQGG